MNCTFYYDYAEPGHLTIPGAIKFTYRRNYSIKPFFLSGHDDATAIRSNYTTGSSPYTSWVPCFDVIPRSKRLVQLRISFGIKSHGKVNGEKRASDETRHCLLLQTISFSGVSGKTVSTFRRNVLTSSSGSKSKPCKEAARSVNLYKTLRRYICSFVPTASQPRKQYSSVTAMRTPESHNAFFCYLDSMVTCSTQYQ
jgi:hypothetical protein